MRLAKLVNQGKWREAEILAAKVLGLDEPDPETPEESPAPGLQSVLDKYASGE